MFSDSIGIPTRDIGAKNIAFSFVLQTNSAQRDFPRKKNKMRRKIISAPACIVPAARLAGLFDPRLNRRFFYVADRAKHYAIARNEMQLRRKEGNETTRRLCLKQAESLIAITIPACYSGAHMENKIAPASLNADRDDRVAEEK